MSATYANKDEAGLNNLVKYINNHSIEIVSATVDEITIVDHQPEGKVLVKMQASFKAFREWIGY